MFQTIYSLKISLFIAATTKKAEYLLRRVRGRGYVTPEFFGKNVLKCNLEEKNVMKVNNIMFTFYLLLPILIDLRL